MASRYLTKWYEQFRSLFSARNTLICVITLCLVYFLGYYHRPYLWIGMKLGKTLPRVPAAQLYHAVIFLLLPLLTLPLLKRGSLNRLGLNLGNWRIWLLDVAVAYAVIAGLILIVGRQPSFLKMYPHYKPAGQAWQTFLWYELICLAYMLGWEFLFRGYMLFGTRAELGTPVAIIVQCLPFALLHVGKPELESIGSILAGFYLGVLAIRANSIIPCVILHFSASVTMDLFAITHQPG
jgi:membrane protease YdiL (CAAX protease family)